MSEKIFVTSPDGKEKLPFDRDKIEKIPYNDGAERAMDQRNGEIMTAKERGLDVAEESRPTSEGTFRSARIMPKRPQ